MAAVKQNAGTGRKGTVSQLRKPVRLTRHGGDLLDGVHPAEVNWAAVAKMDKLAKLVGCRSFVYFISEGEDENGESDYPVKIGFAANPIKRRRELQTGNPRMLVIEQLLLGDRSLERALHTRFFGWAVGDGRRRAGLMRPERERDTEWFRRSDELELAMAQMADRQLKMAEEGMTLARLRDIAMRACPERELADCSELDVLDQLKYFGRVRS